MPLNIRNNTSGYIEQICLFMYVYVWIRLVLEMITGIICYVLEHAFLFF